MSASDGLIRELADRLHRMIDADSDYVPHTEDKALIARARAYLETGGWTRVEDGLPVVPEGSEYVEIFFFCAAPGGRVGRRLWLDIDATVAHGITHWRYAEPTPEPPTGGWTRVEDGLPVVPDGDYDVEIWVVFPSGLVARWLWLDVDTEFDAGITHWRYAEPTPEPPKGYDDD